MNLFRNRKRCSEMTVNSECSLLSHLRDLQQESDKRYNDGLAYIMPTITFDDLIGSDVTEYKVMIHLRSSGSHTEIFEEAIKTIQNTIRYEQVNEEISKLKKLLGIK